MSSSVSRLIDLIDNIKKIDEIILIHSTEADVENDIMLTQYQARKAKLVSSLVNELTTPSFSSAHSLLFIKRFLEKFYADVSYPAPAGKQVSAIKQLESVL